MTTSLEALGISGETISTRAMMLIGYQRTRHISTTARETWEAGDPVPLEREVSARRDDIFRATLAEVWAEYLPLRKVLADLGRHPASVIDIGCGQALNDAFLVKDFDCAVTLVDIEETAEQYHFWQDSGAGYASLREAAAFLCANGARQVTTINPRQTPERLEGLRADLVTSLISCGFHYPVGEYLPLFLNTIRAGGVVVLDLRRRYLRAPDAALQELLAQSRQLVVPGLARKAQRMLFHA
ncbi:MAG: hypothetical protein R3D78_10640 [Paracoccaceae bacterium]|jgi:SAM-dependent methyltransferase